MKVVICVTYVITGPAGKTRSSYSIYPKSYRKSMRKPPYGLVYGLDTEGSARAWCEVNDHEAAIRVIELGTI